MKNKFYQTLFFFFIWLCTGFTLGTLTLLWPVRWWVSFTRAHTYAAKWENMGVLFLIILLIGISFWLSRLIFLAQRKTNQQKTTLLSLVLPFVLALGALTLFMQPELINDQQNAPLALIQLRIKSEHLKRKAIQPSFLYFIRLWCPSSPH